MKKSVEARRSVHEPNPKNITSPNSETEKFYPLRKSNEHVHDIDKPTRPNAHDPVDDELTIPRQSDKEAGKYIPSSAPW